MARGGQVGWLCVRNAECHSRWGWRVKRAAAGCMCCGVGWAVGTCSGRSEWAGTGCPRVGYCMAAGSRVGLLDHRRQRRVQGKGKGTSQLWQFYPGRTTGVGAALSVCRCLALPTAYFTLHHNVARVPLAQRHSSLRSHCSAPQQPPPPPLSAFPPAPPAPRPTPPCHHARREHPHARHLRHPHPSRQLAEQHGGREHVQRQTRQQPPALGREQALERGRSGVHRQRDLDRGRRFGAGCTGLIGVTRGTGHGVGQARIVRPRAAHSPQPTALGMRLAVPVPQPTGLGAITQV